MAKYLFVGPDGAYKTTLAEALHQHLDLPYAKFSQSKSVDEVVQVAKDLANDVNYRDCVLDRFKTIDHIVYGRVIEGLKFSINEIRRMINAHRLLEQSTDKFYLIYVHAKTDVLWERLFKRGDETYVTKHDLERIKREYQIVISLFKANGLLENVIELDTTDVTSKTAFKRLLKELDV